jgi:hypothetical protein
MANATAASFGGQPDVSRRPVCDGLANDIRARGAPHHGADVLPTDVLVCPSWHSK